MCWGAYVSKETGLEVATVLEGCQHHCPFVWGYLVPPEKTLSLLPGVEVTAEQVGLVAGDLTRSSPGWGS